MLPAEWHFLKNESGGWGGGRAVEWQLLDESRSSAGSGSELDT
jgi:hypothetical protein